ncbi:MAG: agmatinase family protein [Bacteroidota bacterium]|nr:agmatinase family protein [Bacteroidota bacterium]
MTKQDKINNFDPNSVGDTTAGMFGLPFTLDECETVLIPVPWEVTVSYSGGTANGPGAIYDASFQVDLYDPNKKDAWKLGIGMDEINEDLHGISDTYREVAEGLIDLMSAGENVADSSEFDDINKACSDMNAWVKERVLHFLKQNKTVGLIGGDHSTPLGMMQALSEHFGKFAILQIDAHADLRIAYEGFEFSHASIMYNALKIDTIEKLVQVGIRDYCEEELNIINESKGRIKTFFDRDIRQASYAGENWQQTCDRIVKELPNNIYLSFDIDGLDPKLCPNTGTPVAGGFEAEQVLYLIEQVVKSGKKFVAFDINEVTPGEENEWDANVAARLLYRIANLVMMSQGK